MGGGKIMMLMMQVILCYVQCCRASGAAWVPYHGDRGQNRGPRTRNMYLITMTTMMMAVVVMMVIKLIVSTIQITVYTNANQSQSVKMINNINTAINEDNRN